MFSIGICGRLIVRLYCSLLSKKTAEVAVGLIVFWIEVVIDGDIEHLNAFMLYVHMVADIWHWLGSYQVVVFDLLLLIGCEAVPRNENLDRID